MKGVGQNYDQKVELTTLITAEKYDQNVEWTTLINAANTDRELHRLAITDDFLFSLRIADIQWCQKKLNKRK